MTISSKLEQELARRIEVINSYYNLDDLLERKTDSEAIARYYRKSDFFYNVLNSKGGGNIHFGLSDTDKFYKSDLKKQAQFIDEFIEEDTKKILEVGAGKVANTKWLAKKHPEISFTALDLPHRNFKRNRVPRNVKLCEGSYNDLSRFKENSFDIIFGVETVCYSEDKEQTIKEISRILKPSGKLILFDIYEPKPHSEMTEFEKHVSMITTTAMCLPPNGHYIGDYEKYMLKYGFKTVEITNLTSEAMPSIKRIARLSNYYFNHPRFLKTLRATIDKDATMNSIAGWLMPLTFDGENIHEYGRIVATKK